MVNNSKSINSIHKLVNIDNGKKHSLIYHKIGIIFVSLMVTVSYFLAFFHFYHSSSDLFISQHIISKGNLFFLLAGHKVHFIVSCGINKFIL